MLNAWLKSTTPIVNEFAIFISWGLILGKNYRDLQKNATFTLEYAKPGSVIIQFQETNSEQNSYNKTGKLGKLGVVHPESS